ncbi:MAG TPA: hypothetical protein VHV78_18450 [Gemmatimonadaceae bacterium]|nr:hypothetical protein [Gemmatimonadaceae bacterium]
MNAPGRTLFETTTSLGASDVLARAKTFFPSRPSIYSTFLDKESSTFCSFRGQGGEEIVIGVSGGEGGTRVTGSSYLFDMQVSRFFTTLPPAGAP